METAKIDIRKLQLLNDRINHTIDALNQVRMSVHGLSHSNTIGTTNLGLSWNPSTFVPTLPTTTPIGWSTVPLNYAQSPVPNPTFAQPLAYANILGGLNHSTPEMIDANTWNRPVTDLSYLARINQTFPFAYSPIPSTFGF